MGKTIIFTSASDVKQDGVTLIELNKAYEIHEDKAIGEFFIGEQRKYGIIDATSLSYFTRSERYNWKYYFTDECETQTSKLTLTVPKSSFGLAGAFPSSLPVVQRVTFDYVRDQTGVTLIQV